MVKKLLLIAVIMFINRGTANAETFAISNFATDGLSGWTTKSFKGQTNYSLVRENGSVVVKAFSSGSASGLFKKTALDPKRFRYLRWSWKVTDSLPKGDESSKSGDDYAARVYVVFPGRFFWQTRAINYVWANRLALGNSIPNPYTGNAIMVAVESGISKAGRWTSEERDILSDYRRLFGDEPREIGAVAIMTDTDDTGGESTAWYGDITISTSR